LTRLETNTWPSTVLSVARIDLTAHPGRVFAVGDLHGMAHAFERLLDLAGFDPARDLVWSLGDLVDRGPFSARCLDLLEEPWFRAIRGNHEQLMLDALGDRGTWLQWTVNGGDWALGFPWDDPRVRAPLEALPWAADLVTAAGHIGLIHADVDRTCDWPELLEALETGAGLARQVALWSRGSANQAQRGMPGRHIGGVDLVLVGHCIVERCFQWGNMWFLDSGAVVSDDPSAALSMLEIHPRLKLWSLPTARDPSASLWWSRQMERVSAAVAGL
jgi:serine/threonine protein phosphatase 1